MFINSKDEKRATARLTLASKVSILDDKHNKIQGILQDLSATGVSIKTDTRLDTGSSCNLSITIEGNNSNLMIDELSAKVIRFNDNVVALEFKDKMEWLTLFYVYKNKFKIDKK